MMYIDRLIIFNKMCEQPLRLNQIVSDKQVRKKYWSQMHKVNNSLKRGATYVDPFPVKNSTFYQSRLPDMEFGRKDLSLILRYLLHKQEMNLADRNLLRRILISVFDEDFINAGTKKFINFLKFQEGDQRCHITSPDLFYFLLKGQGVVTSRGISYEVKKGDYFGELQILSNQQISSIRFDGGYILLTLQKSAFNLFFRNYFFNKYQSKKKGLCCLAELYFHRISELAKYLLLKCIQYTTFTQGQKIVQKGQLIDTIYFQTQHDHSKPPELCHDCLGLFQTINGLNSYVQTVVCQKKRMKVSYLPISAFREYALGAVPSESFQSKEMDKSMINLNKSFLAINGLEPPPERPKLGSFLTRKKVKLSMKHNRIKTEMKQYCQTDFKFIRTQFSTSSFLSRTKNVTHLSNSLPKKYNSSKLTKKTCY